MALLKKLFTNFSRGELSELIEGRPDLAAFFNGCKVLENFWIYYEGGVFRRYGTKKIAEIKNSAKKTISIPFKFNITQMYFIEAGDLYFRFYRRGFGGNNNLTPIVDGGGVPIEIVTPYTENNLKELQWTQSADVLYLTYPSYQQRKLIRVSDTSWTLSVFNADPPPSFEAGTNLAEVLAPAANTGTGIRFYAKSGIFLAGDVGREIIAGASRATIKTLVSALEVTADIIDAFTATITAGPGTITTVGTALTSTVNHGLAIDNYVTVTSGAQAGQIRRVTAVPTSTTATLDAAFPADIAVAATWNKVIEMASGAWLLRNSPQTTLDPDIKGPKGATVNLIFGVAAARSADVGKFVKMYGGLIKLTVFTDTQHMAGVIKSILADSTADNPAAAPANGWSLEISSWSDTRGWPSAVEFHQGRLAFGGTALEPTTWWESKPDNFEDFSIGSLANDAVAYAIANRSVNIIEWLKSLKQLFIGDAENEHLARGPGIDQPLGGDVIPFVAAEGDEGSMSTMALAIQRAILFIHAFGRQVFELIYSINDDGFVSNDLTWASRDIAGPRVASTGRYGLRQHPPAYAKKPNSIVFFPREDGQAACLTYYRRQEVAGWARLLTDGEIESISTGPDRTYGKDDIVMIIKRTINGATKRFIECVVGPEDFATNLTNRSWQEFHTDCGIDGAITGGFPVSSIGGLSHLEGKAVDLIINPTTPANVGGSYKGRFTVVGGAITLSEPIETACQYEIGLPYTSTLQTMRPAVQGIMTEGHMRQWVKLFLRLIKSIGGKVNGEKINYPAAPLDQTLLRSGDFSVHATGGDLDGYVTVVQDQPYPFRASALFGEIEFSDRM